MSDQDKKLDQKGATTPEVAQTDAELAEKLSQLDFLIQEAKALNERTAAKEKELDELKTKFQAGKEVSEEEKIQIAEHHKGKAQRMKESLAKQEKVSIFIPLEGKEKPGTQLPVTPNGYRVNIPKGVYIKVPRQIAEIVMESLNQTEQATQVSQRVDLLPEDKQERLA